MSVEVEDVSSSGVMYASTISKFGVYSEIPDMIQSIRKLVTVSFSRRRLQASDIHTS